MIFLLSKFRKTCEPIFVEGDRGAGARENRGREEYGRREEKEAGSGIPKVVGTGRKEDKFRNIA